MKEREICIKRLKKRCKLFNVALRLVVSDWLVIELSDSKLYNNNLASELVENGSFLNKSQLKKL